MQQYRRPIQSCEHYIRGAVVIEVSDCEAARAVAGFKNSSRVLSNVLKHPLSVIVQQQWRLAILHIAARRLDGLVDVAVGDYKIEASVVVIVDELRPPSNI